MRNLSFSFLMLTALVLLGTDGRHARPEGPSRSAVDPSTSLALPVATLTLRAGLRLTESPRGMREAFPYIAFHGEGPGADGPVTLTPTNLGDLLEAPTTQRGRLAAVSTPEAAIEAVRLFVAGPLVRSKPEGERLIEAGRTLARELEYLPPRVVEHRPSAWAPTARPLPADRSERPTETWQVSLVALEIDRVLRLVHVDARVSADGAVELQRTPIVAGPMTTWQVAVMGEWTEEDDRRQARMQEEVVQARRRYAQALGLRRDVGDVWAIARLVHDVDRVELFLGPSDRTVGSGLRMPTYDLLDGTIALFAAAPDRVVYVRQIEAIETTMRWGPTLGSWYVARR